MPRDEVAAQVPSSTELHVPAYNEPPDMLIETIQSLERLDYPNLQIIVIDNNTKDPETWQPVARWCEGRERVRFVHVQTPQDDREYQGDAYLTACYDAYKYFFTTSMPSRNERNSIIFAGTTGLLRRSALEQLGGSQPAPQRPSPFALPRGERGGSPNASLLGRSAATTTSAPRSGASTSTTPGSSEGATSSSAPTSSSAASTTSSGPTTTTAATSTTATTSSGPGEQLHHHAVIPPGARAPRSTSVMRRPRPGGSGRRG